MPTSYASIYADICEIGYYLLCVHVRVCVLAHVIVLMRDVSHTFEHTDAPFMCGAGGALHFKYYSIWLLWS